MKRLEKGEMITLENGKEYIILDEHIEDENDYIFLMSNFKPLEIRVAVQIQEGNDIKIDKVKDQEKVNYLLEIFKTKNIKN